MAVKGLDRLLRQMKALPKLQVEAVAAAQLAGANDLAAAIERAAPKRSGATKKSVQVVTGAEAANTGDEGALIKAQAGLAVKVVAGDDDAFYVRFIEHGTAGAPAGAYRDKKGKARKNKVEHHATPAQPFFWPTVRAQKARLKRRVSKAANQAAKAAAAIR